MSTFSEAIIMTHHPPQPVFWSGRQDWPRVVHFHVGALNESRLAIFKNLLTNEFKSLGMPG